MSAIQFTNLKTALQVAEKEFHTDPSVETWKVYHDLFTEYNYHLILAHRKAQKVTK